MSKSKIPLPQAQSIANELMELLEPHCMKIRVAGSIRRKKPEVGDVEMVLIPKPTIFGYIDELLETKRIQQAQYGTAGTARWGKKYRGIQYRGIQFDVFIVDQWNAGYQLWLRTGPGDANTYIMSRIKRGAPFRLDGGYVYDLHDNRIQVSTEQDWWNLLNIRAIPPEGRTELAYREAFKWHEWEYPKRTVRLATCQLGKHAPDNVLDITIKGKTDGTSSAIGQLFAPTWDMLNAYKDGSMTWDEYRDRYLDMIRRRYADQPYPFEKLLRQPDITLGCYCRDGEPCHRLIAVYILSSIANALDMNVIYNGEIVPEKLVTQLELF